ncbi:MAG: GNAT family N-acetyltransferase [Actinomycetota bacterium]
MAWSCLRPFARRTPRRWSSGTTNAEMARWFDFPPLPAESEHLARVRHVIRAWQADYAAGVRIAWAVRDKRTCALVGSVELRPRADGGVDASYATHPTHRGRGLASRSLRLACKWALERAGFNRVVVEYDARNAASGAVAKAAGFIQVDYRVGGMRYEHADGPGDAVLLELAVRNRQERIRKA